ncbi:hypothetical protein PR048_011223 [Dryococelus australis]|uniref:Uncharacterized protein n=1 Tax=Dryococelus australis TaxID=614101 RepID=A0ABQ9HL09_9NEOP|nr:hypothetical protein PR048_011223 [Dryococelus australis]
MLASEAMKQAPEVRTVILLTLIGQECMELYNTFDNTFEMSIEEKKDLAKVLKAFESYCSPKANMSVERHIFFNTRYTS